MKKLRFCFFEDLKDSLVVLDYLKVSNPTFYDLFRKNCLAHVFIFVDEAMLNARCFDQEVFSHS